MADYDNPRPSSQPVGSVDLAVAKDDLITLDLMVTAESGTEITNRKGQKLTPLVDVIDGANSIIADELNRAPFQIVGDFADGFQIDYRSQVGQAVDGTIWRYTGALPFTVPAGTLPSAPLYEQIYNPDHDQMLNLDGRGHGAIHKINTTVSEVITGKYNVGDRLTLTDRAGASFNVVSGGVANGYDVINAGAGKAAVLSATGAVNPLHWGAAGDGIKDDSLVFQFIASKTSESITIENQYLINTPTTIPNKLIFNGGRIISGASSFVQIGIPPVSADSAFIFEGDIRRDTTRPKWDKASADWFGSGLGFDDAPLIERCFQFSDNVKMMSPAYTLNSTVNIPDNRFLHIEGSGFRTTHITTASGVIGFDYQRTEDSPATVMSIDGIAMSELNLTKQGFGIRFHGFSAGSAGAETKVQDDNWLRIKNCYFSGYSRAIDTRFAGQCHFENNWYQANVVSHFMQRGSSFFYFSNCMNLSCGSFINATDTVADAYTNGLFITNCNSVTCSSDDLVLVGLQAVFITGCGFDLGYGGNESILLTSCQDVKISNSWIASDLAQAPQRDGIRFETSRNSSVMGCTMVNHEAAIILASCTGIGISENQFEGCTSNDVLGLVASTGISVTSNKHRTNIPISGIKAPIYANITGNEQWIVKNNILKNVTYSISIGSTSIVNDNIFGWAV